MINLINNNNYQNHTFFKIKVMVNLHTTEKNHQYPTTLSLESYVLQFLLQFTLLLNIYE